MKPKTEGLMVMGIELCYAVWRAVLRDFLLVHLC